MSDSDCDELLPRNVFTFPNESAIVSASGPSINFTDTGTSFRSNLLSSTRQMPLNIKRPPYAKSCYDQRSTYRRDVSPMSVRSICDGRQRNFNYSYNRHGMGSRSIYNGRGVSPMSMRSIDSSASISAFEIKNALKNGNFSEHELKEIIKQARNKFIRYRHRKKIDKRTYRKTRRRISGYDSGEQGSNSSISSEDKSTRTVNFEDNMSSGRSAITDISNFRRTIKNSSVFKDCTESLKQHLFQRTSSSVNLNNTQMSLISNRSMMAESNMPMLRNQSKPANFDNMRHKQAPAMFQKERFTNGFSLPSQRFNRPGTSTTISEYAENEVYNQINQQNELPSVTNKTSGRNIDTDIDEEDIFSNANMHKPSTNTQRKRSIDNDDDIFLPNLKRHKPLSPCKNSKEAQKLNKFNTASNNSDKAEDFIFAKPTFPVKKPVKEKFISKSAAPSLDTLVEAPISQPTNLQPRQVHPLEEDKEKEYHNSLNHNEEKDDEPSNYTQNSTNLSMRPSFIKRKLFTQKLDISEKRNLSTDSVNSPQNSLYGAIQKERKARKLQQVTTQSCLNRDLQQDDNNLFDLIQKIVPTDQMNVTNQSKKTDMQSKFSNATDDNSEKWDVTSIISTRMVNDDDVSDTFTDEEILNSTVLPSTKEQKKEKVLKKKTAIEKENIAKQNEPQKENFIKESALKNKEKVIKENGHGKDDFSKESALNCKEKLINQHPPLNKENVFQKPPVKLNNCEILLEKLPPNMYSQRIKEFWDTDFESDIECTSPLRNSNYNSKENLKSKSELCSKEHPENESLRSVLNFKIPSTGSNATFQNYTFDKIQKINTSTLRIKSHRAPKRNKHERTMDLDAKSTYLEPELKKQKIYSPPKLIAKEDKQTVMKKDKKSPNGKKQTSKEKVTESVKKIKSQKSYESAKKPNRKIINNEELTKKLRNNNVRKSPQKTANRIPNEIQKDEQTKRQSKPDKIERKKVEPKTLSTKNPISKNIEKAIAKNNSRLTEEINNKCSKPIRSCRLNSSNISTNMSNGCLNTTAIRTLRPRKSDISNTSHTDYKKDMKNNNTQKDAKTRLRDISFSLSIDKKSGAKRSIKKVTNFSLFKADESDVSFTLKDQSLSPRRTRSTSIRNNLSKSIFVHQNPSPVKDLFVSKHKQSRNRVPNKKYLS